jgi:hypothetical protein
MAGAVVKRVEQFTAMREALEMPAQHGSPARDCTLGSGGFQGWAVESWDVAWLRRLCAAA